MSIKVCKLSCLLNHNRSIGRLRARGLHLIARRQASTLYASSCLLARCTKLNSEQKQLECVPSLL
eukprot:6202814-Pleurochrysis_carterae.AAC.2